MTGALVILIAGTGAVSERGPDLGGSASQAGRTDKALDADQRASLPRSETCPYAHRAIKFYRARIAVHANRMGRSLVASPPIDKRRCQKHVAHVLQRKARAWRLRAEAWWRYHYDWRSWLPAKHRRVGACETGYGREPGDFSWDSGTYVSFAGIYRSGYDDDAHRIGNLGWDETKRKLSRLPTPREQMQAVDSHRAAHGGWSGWGCRGS